LLEERLAFFAVADELDDEPAFCAAAKSLLADTQTSANANTNADRTLLKSKRQADERKLISFNFSEYQQYIREPAAEVACNPAERHRANIPTKHRQNRKIQGTKRVISRIPDFYCQPYPGCYLVNALA
jgi:hypothetical protein